MVINLLIIISTNYYNVLNIIFTCLLNEEYHYMSNLWFINIKLKFYIVIYTTVIIIIVRSYYTHLYSSNDSKIK